VLQLSRLPGGACDVGGDDIGGVPVQAAAGPVVPDRGARVRVRRRLLHVPQGHSGIQGGGDEGVSERVGRDGLADSRAAGGLADDPPGAVPVQPSPVRGQEHRAAGPFPDGQVDRAGGARRQRDGDDLAALAGDRQGPVAALEAQVLDVGAGGLGDPQAVEREQGDQRMLGRRAEPGGNEQGAELVAVQRDGVGLVVRPRPPDMSGWGVIQEFLLDRVLLEPGDSGQPAGDRGAGPSPGLQVAGEAFDVGAADGEQGQGAGAAPGSELAQVERVGLAGRAAVSGQVPGEGEPFGVGEGGLDRGEDGGWAAVVIGHLPAGLEPEDRAGSGSSG